MRKSGPFVVAFLPINLLLLGFVSSLVAQTGPTAPINPTMPSQRFDSDKEALYSEFSGNKKGITPDQQQQAYWSAKEYLRRYGGVEDTYTREAKKFIADFEKGVYQYELYTAYNAKNYAKAFERGRPLLKGEPENFFALGLLAEAGYENAQAGNASLNEETVDYLRRALQLVEAGKVSNPDPFKSLATADGFLHLALGWFLKDKSPREAAAAFVKAVQSHSPYENDALAYYRLGMAILKGEFAEVSVDYNQNFGTKAPSPEQQAMFERINKLGERAIDALARSVALSDPNHPVGPTRIPPEARDKVLAQLTALYKSLHHNSDAGLSELIAGVLSKPLPQP